MYKFYNANSHNNFINDCFPRAYSVVMNITWAEAYKELCKSAMEQGHMMDSVVFVRKFLDKKFKRVPYKETYQPSQSETKSDGFMVMSLVAFETVLPVAFYFQKIADIFNDLISCIGQKRLIMRRVF